MKNADNETKETNPETKWFDQARNQTLETLPKFTDQIMNSHHDYNSVVHAIAACALATAYACDHSSNGGITGFQAGFVMWGKNCGRNCAFWL